MRILVALYSTFDTDGFLKILVLLLYMCSVSFEFNDFLRERQYLSCANLSIWTAFCKELSWFFCSLKRNWLVFFLIDLYNLFMYYADKSLSDVYCALSALGLPVIYS